MALDKNQIAQRIAREVKDGYYVNLGIGIPTLVANFVRNDIEVEFQSENGVLGMGPFPFEGEEDPDRARPRATGNAARHEPSTAYAGGRAAAAGRDGPAQPRPRGGRDDRPDP